MRAGARQTEHISKICGFSCKCRKFHSTLSDIEFADTDCEWLGLGAESTAFCLHFRCVYFICGHKYAKWAHRNFARIETDRQTEECVVHGSSCRINNKSSHKSCLCLCAITQITHLYNPRIMTEQWTHYSVSLVYETTIIVDFKREKKIDGSRLSMELCLCVKHVAARDRSHAPQQRCRLASQYRI